MDGTRGILGIDAGGTFTDLAFLANGKIVEARVKVPTRHDDLAATIGEGIDLILREVDAWRIGDVHLASTLATNATVENKTVPSGLILIGYDEEDIKKAVDRNLFGPAEVESVPGGHDEKGNEKEPLDEAKVIESSDALLEKNVEGIAISGYFSVRNPTHEIRAKELLKLRHPNISITCGHELASELDAFKRAATAAINAGLIPIIIKLLEAVKNVMHGLGINASLSVVKGDGSLVSAEWAESHPVETVVSGPAASAMGARFLAGVKKSERPSWIVDIGGTTTDIICLDKHGNPVLKNEGASIGGHEILVKTIDIRTFGLGGDSRIVRTKDGSLKIGPRRVIPLAVAASEEPSVVNMLREIETSPSGREPVIVFPGKGKCSGMPAEERIMKKLAKGPATLEYLAHGEKIGVVHSIGQIIDKMDERGAAVIAAFTPTDALTVLRRLDKWDNQASSIGAGILASSHANAAEAEAFCLDVCEAVSRNIAWEVFRKALCDDGLISKNSEYDSHLKIGLRSRELETGPGITLHLNGNMIGVGAPAWAFMERAASMLSEKAALPEDAPVGGAVGAAVGTFFMRHVLLITPLVKTGGFRVHLPNGIKDFDDLEKAASDSVNFMIPWLKSMAAEAGGTAPEIEWTRKDEVAIISGGARSIHLWTRIMFNVEDGGA
ncbi:MAG: hydantoinase/oxoprolinase family protein [Synergistaceae bacterium]|nr:hydantoinase/oxoprolinase family protein [Synergistaceae bacterium]